MTNNFNKKFTAEQVAELNRKFADSSAQEILEWATNLHPRIALATSFQAQGVVLIDMFTRINKKARIFTLDTGRLNEETYQVIDAIRSKYAANIEIIFPDKNEVEEMVRQHGPNLFYKGKDMRYLCCDVRKVRPLDNYLPKLDGWITSIRKNQTQSRAESKRFELDELHGGLLKINPLVDWSSKEVWDYIKEHRVPYNKLHDLGYPSIGCAPCTRAVKDGEDPRAGRWWWESDSDKECGLHFNHTANS